jgi:hypothetical protein
MLSNLPSQLGDQRYRGLMLRAEGALTLGDDLRANGLYYQAYLAAGHAMVEPRSSCLCPFFVEASS